MFIKHITRAAAVTIILTLATACALSPDGDTTTDLMDEENETLLLMGEDDGKPTTHEDLERILATTKARSVANPARDKHDASEDQHWCQAWALDNLAPHVYAEFLQLDPEDMDDLDRSVCRERLPRDTRGGELPTYDHGGNPDGQRTRWHRQAQSGVCWMYWSEPLNKANADKRNRQYEAECLYYVAERADSQWADLASAAVSDEDSPAYEIPNQYVRLLKWLDTPGRKLLKMAEPPHELLRRLAYAPWAYSPNVPSRGQIRQARTEHGPAEAEYWGLLNATLAHRGYRSKACQAYYPQLFYGYWVPFAEPSDKPHRQLSEEELAQVEHLREGPLYLPRP